MDYIFTTKSIPITYNLHLKNVGIIKDANIEFGGLTVIAGENDTGKSTVGKMIYSIIKSISKYDDLELGDVEKIDTIGEIITKLYFSLRRRINDKETIEKIRDIREKTIMAYRKKSLEDINTIIADLDELYEIVALHIHARKKCDIAPINILSESNDIVSSSEATLDEKDLEQILRCISIVSFRYNVISTLATNIQERTYNKVAQNISQGELQGTTEIIMALKDIYVPDQRFEPAFAEKILKTTSSRNKKIARYILFAIEKHLTGKDYDIESSKYTLEHILPENPEKGWDEFRDSQLDEAIYRLGNFTILEAELNREGGNKDFKEKREIYQKSGFKITRLIAEENEEWNMSRLV